VSELSRIEDREDCLALAANTDTQGLMARAAVLRDAGFGDIITYSRKVFIPLTQLCRDVCHYCTFAQTPKEVGPAFLSIEQVLEIARAGAVAGCTEALFTLGDKPELRYRAAREWLDEHGYASTLDYLEAAARAVLEETGLLPHLNPGLMDAGDYAKLRKVSASMGIMLESASARLCAKGMPHHGSPDKLPEPRLATIALAGEMAVPFTSGLLIGIGETRMERIESMLALRDLHDLHGHLQEVIIQNFRAKPDTKMADAPEPDLDDHLWTLAVARLVFGPDISIQAPPNLAAGALSRLIDAGINDWGGVSPVTPDFVNPEAPWPHLEVLGSATAAAGKVLAQRLPVYPAWLQDMAKWIDPEVRQPVRELVGADGLAREDRWAPGRGDALPAYPARKAGGQSVSQVLGRLAAGDELGEAEIVTLFGARGEDLHAVCAAADDLRRKVNGDVVSYVVTRNINYTNICTFRCTFCAFSKGRGHANLRGPAYQLSEDEIARRVAEAWERGATEVCMQGGIHPAYTGETYLDICRIVKDAAPGMHIHAFSPLEIWQGAETLGISVGALLERLKKAGLGSLPGTAAEILDDEVRGVICPDKVNTAQWLEVIGTAHEVGLKTTSTIMFGHVERVEHWARHLLRLRALQDRTGGITEFVPLPFVHMESPMYIKGAARPGPSWRETMLIHAVARLVLHPLIPNIQASWVKLGEEGLAALLNAGVNDIGGTLMNETISRSAGASHGQEMTPQSMEAIIRAAGRTPRLRTTLYADAPAERRAVAFAAAPLEDIFAQSVPAE
jgi:FO synthase